MHIRIWALSVHVGYSGNSASASLPISPNQIDQDTDLLSRFRRSRLKPAMMLSVKARMQPNVDIRKAEE